MHPAEQDERCVGTIYIEEVLPYQEAQVGGQCVHHGESIIFVERSVADLPSACTAATSTGASNSTAS